MGSESNLKTWVSDKLISLLGYSQPTLVQYIIGLSKQAVSPADVLVKLVEFGLSSSSETRAFSEEIFARVPRKSSGLNLYQKQERDAAMLAKKQKSYAILDADDDDDDNDVGGNVDHRSSTAAAPETRKVDTHRKRFRKKIESQEDEDEDDEVIAQRETKRQAKRRTSEDEDDGSESEEERLRDQREREQLERNIRERDAAGTRKLTEPKLTRREEEEEMRRSNALEQNGLETLRKGGHFFCIIERSKKMSKSLHLSERMVIWMAKMVKDCLRISGNTDSFKTRRDGNRVFMAQKCQNTFGRFVKLIEFCTD